MKKILLMVLLLTAQAANAGILSNIFGNNSYYPAPVRYRTNPYYNNGYYYNNNGRYYPQNRYYNRYPQNYYYNQQPVIHRTRVRRSQAESNEKQVANQFSGIGKLESQLLFQTYEYDNPKNRIERLEHKIFGASQQGSLEERLMVLQSAAKNYKAFNPDSSRFTQNTPQYSGYQPPIFTGTMGSSWRNTLMGNLKNQFTGTPTGFTPAMDPAYMDWFEAERAMGRSGQDIDYRSNTGYYKSKTNSGSGMGVTILD